MQSPPSRRWFVWFAPLTVPLYVLYLALMSLIAGGYYISIEMTLAPLLGRPLALSGWRFWLAAAPAVLLLPLAVACHVAWWLVRQFGRWFAAVGRWQSGLRPAWIAAPIGAVWLAATAWVLIACIDPLTGLKLAGRPLDAGAKFESAMRRRTTLRDVLQDNPAARVRYDRLLESLTTGVNRNDEFAQGRREELLELDTPAQYLSGRMRAIVFGIPWYFHHGIQSEDALDHCEFLIGPLLLALVLLPRWPRMHAGRRRRMAPLLFAARFAVAVGAVTYALTWAPLDLTPRINEPGPWSWLAPLSWFGYPADFWVPPQWIPLNAAAWLILLGLLVLLVSIARAMRPSLGPPGYYSAYLAVRLLQRKRIAFFSIGAVTLCVAMELIVISVMGGFLDTIRARAHGLMGDLVMDAGLTGFPYYDEFIAELRARADVREATPVIYSYGILRFPQTSRTKAVEVRGIRLNEFARVNDFGKKDGLFYNTYYPGTTTFAPAGQPVYGVDPQTETALLPPSFEAARKVYEQSLPLEERGAFDNRWPRAPRSYYYGPGVFEAAADLTPGLVGRELPGIVIGRHIIAWRNESGEFDRTLQYPRGTVVQLSLLPMTRRGQVSTESPPAPLLRYVDDSRTGVFEIDSRTVYVDFDYLQGILDMTPQKRAEGDGRTPARCTSIQIKLKSSEQMTAAKLAVSDAWERFALRQPADMDDQAAMGNVQVNTCEELQRDFIAAIQKEKVLVVIMFGIISVVAVLLVLCIFYMIVVEKTRDIGILKSVGGSAQGVAAVFLTYGAAIGVVGATLGSILGAVFVRHINEFQDWLARLNPEWRIWSPTTYSFDRIPDTVKLDEMLWIAGLAILASIIGAALPAARAARTWPVEALRYE